MIAQPCALSPPTVLRGSPRPVSSNVPRRGGAGQEGGSFRQHQDEFGTKDVAEIEAGTRVLRPHSALDRVGVGLDFVGINPVKALYLTAAINGLLAPFVLVAILVVASDKKLMQGQPSSRLGWTVGAITTAAMFAAGVGMFVA